MRHIVIYTSYFSPRNYSAITLFPFVFHDEAWMSEREVHHKTVHLHQ